MGWSKREDAEKAVRETFNRSLKVLGQLAKQRRPTLHSKAARRAVADYVTWSEVVGQHWPQHEALIHYLLSQRYTAVFNPR